MNDYIIVTGGYGFIGSHFVNGMYEYCKARDIKLVVIDKLGVGSCAANVTVPHVFHYCDLATDSFQDLMWSLAITEGQRQAEGIFHFAAESHVDRSIDNPIFFVESNVLGMTNLLESIRKWHPDTKLVNVSTDEVYGHLTSVTDPAWTEDSPLQPRSPYSASKASADMLANAYASTYGLNITTTRCANNFGPNQGDEKFIPTVIRNMVHGKSIPVYGDGTNRREWIPVLSHCDQIFRALNSGYPVKNILGGYEYSNVELIEIIEGLMVQMHGEGLIANSYKAKIEFVEDRKGHDKRYALVSKYRRDANWFDFDHEMKKTIKHYVDKYMKKIMTVEFTDTVSLSG